MREPGFWYAPAGWQSLVLRPLGWAYAQLTARRLRNGSSYSAKVPVICIGNINAGGTGKTPTAMALAQRLQSWGYDTHIVSRGYRGSLQGPVRVIDGKHKADEAGDEALLLASFAPTWVAKDRAAGVQAAEAAGAEVILLDDGFQNPSVAKDISLIVVDADRGFGNGRVIPAGPLREPIKAGLNRADVVLLIGKGTKVETHLGTISRTRGRLAPLQTGMTWTDLPVLAFAGIGNPNKFFATLRELGAKVVKSEPLEDHQPLTPALMKRLETEAKAHVAQMVTTEKDAVRLPDAFRAKVLTLPVRLEIEDWSPIDETLANAGLQSSKS